jgi:hypothetical protein
MKHDASDVMLAVRSARRPMHRFDDVVSAAEVEKGLLYSAGFKAHRAGRTCARPVWWRTIRVMTTTRRPGDREARDSAARRPPSAAEGRASGSPAASPERLASVARFLRGPHHLANEALRSLGALVAVTDAAGARVEVIAPRGHCWECARRSQRWRLAR